MLEPTHEETKYLHPSLDAHGHCVLRQNGRWGIAPYVITEVKHPPVEEATWIGFIEEADKDAMEDRRRIRGKNPAGLRRRLRRLHHMKQLVSEEAKVTEREFAVMTKMMVEKLTPFKEEIKKEEVKEQEILQTKIVSPQELLKEVDLWDEAIRSELKSLFDDRKALKIVTPEEVKAMEKERRIPPDVVPSKLVITRKPGGRRKIRIVACGNYIPKREDDDLFASGSDAVGVRVALKKAAISRWRGYTIDIKTAFLNAPLGQEGEEALVILRPPQILVRLGYVKAWELWLAIMAMYGLRQSPKAWSVYRDHELHQDRKSVV